MSVKVVLVFYLISILIDKGTFATGLRQKRCIVIQKQSGSRGQSAENDDDDDNYRRPQPKEPPSDRLRRPAYDDAEDVPSELLKYKTFPMKIQNNLRKRFLESICNYKCYSELDCWH